MSSFVIFNYDSSYYNNKNDFSFINNDETWNFNSKILYAITGILSTFKFVQQKHNLHSINFIDNVYSNPFLLLYIAILFLIYQSIKKKKSNVTDTILDVVLLLHILCKLFYSHNRLYI